MVSKDAKPVVRELMNPYEKPPSMSFSQSFRQFIYNPETGAFMGRTAISWGTCPRAAPGPAGVGVFINGRRTLVYASPSAFAPGGARPRA